MSTKKSKKDKTIEDYELCAATLDLLDEVAMHIWYYATPLIGKSKMDELRSVLRKIDKIRSKLDDELFRDFPNLPYDYTHLFYHISFDKNPKSELAAKVISLSRDIGNEIINGKTR